MPAVSKKRGRLHQKGSGFDGTSASGGETRAKHKSTESLLKGLDSPEFSCRVQCRSMNEQHSLTPKEMEVYFWRR